MIKQAVVFGVLALALISFAWGRWRYDLTALMALLVVTLAGIVTPTEAFAGFGHPAVITVAAVLVVSRGLLNSGLVDAVARLATRVGGSPTLQVAALSGLVAALSAFMNNVGALALLLPVALRMARKNSTRPSLLLMPLAFGSLLGGLTTAIGTPPNIIISTFRAQNGMTPFRLFDFSPVGVGIALAGLVFITLLGWRLIPRREGQRSGEDLFELADYVTEVCIPEQSPLVDKPLRELEEAVENEITVVGLVRGERRLAAPAGYERLRPQDILIVRADQEALKDLVDTTKLNLVGSEELDREALGSEGVIVTEAVVTPDALIAGRSARSLGLRHRYGVNLLAVSRQGAGLGTRLGETRLRPGDVLLLQGGSETLPEVLSTLGCLPLAERSLRVGQPRRVVLAGGVFLLAIVGAALGFVPIQVAFVAAATAMVLIGLVSAREMYLSIDWPVIVLLGAMIPVGQALERTGGAQAIAAQVVALGRALPPEGTLAVVLIATMFLSDIINNAAAAVLMAPIAIGVAHSLGASLDPFLMAVAIGASSAFLTPIGHQSNTLVMGPGGYRFGDYWRMGLPLEIVLLAVGVPLLLRIWPL